MGKRGFKGRRRAGGGGGSRDTGGWKDYPVLVKENKKLQDYYDGLLQLSEEETLEFWEALRRELPNSFRFCGSKGHAVASKRLLESRYIPEIAKIEHQDGSLVEAPKPVAWYPENLAWWMTTPKQVVRKFPPFAKFQKFLVSETSIGNMSRQEVVSMIPPQLMDLRPGMTVLDMCAAPGSKSAQLLEMVHAGEEARVRKVLRSFAQEDGLDIGPETKEELEADLSNDPSDAGRATGLLIANDSDYKRVHMLVHQLKRLSSPNLVITNHDASQFPSIRLRTDETTGKNIYLKFDRILADVPCSGDGTIRKNANLWSEWQPGNALGLHNTQMRILVRALQLLKIGGRVVYSTCSMNPVENEAVIASAIERCGGADNVEIVDCSDQLPELKRKPGMKSWNIMDKANRTWGSWQEVQDFAANENEGVIPGKVVKTMFSDPETPDLPLDRCMRVYPHMQDTGGFFITVLTKKKEFRAKNENEARITGLKSNGASETATPVPTEETTTNDAAPTDGAPKPDISVGDKRPLEEGGDEPAAKKSKTEQTEEEESKPTNETSTPMAEVVTQSNDASSKGRKNNNNTVEEPFKYLDPSHPVVQNIRQFYHISNRFPDNRFMVRNEMGEPAKGIYYTTQLTRDILTENEGRGFRFMHAGVRMFMKQDSPSADVCRWRIQSEGMPILQGYVGEPRVVHLRNKETLRRLLIEMFPKISDDEWKNFDEIGERVRDIGMGCCVVRIEPTGDDPEFSERMALPLWKSFQSLNLMLPKEDRSAMLLRIYNDTTPLMNNTLQKKKTEERKGEASQSETKENGTAQTPAEDQAQELDSMAVEDLPSPE